MGKSLKIKDKIETNASFPREPLFAVLCPDTKEYFLAPASQAFSKTLVSKYTSRLIPAESRIIQYMPSDHVKFWDKQFFDEVIPIARKALKSLKSNKFDNRKLGLHVDFLSDLGAHVADMKTTLSKHGISASLGKLGPQIVSDALTIGKQNAEYEYMSAYIAAHTVTADVIQNHVVVFSVGIGGGLIFAADLGLVAPANIRIAEKIGIIAAIVLEIVIIIGTLMGVRGNEQKCAEAIQEAMKNSRIVQAIIRLAEAVASGAKTVAEFIRELVSLLYSEGLLGSILSAYLVGILSLVGILWLIASLLAKLVPGVGWAVTAAKLIACGAGLVVKFNKLFS